MYARRALSSLVVVSLDSLDFIRLSRPFDRPAADRERFGSHIALYACSSASRSSSYDKNNTAAKANKINKHRVSSSFFLGPPPWQPFPLTRPLVDNFAPLPSPETGRASKPFTCVGRAALLTTLYFASAKLAPTHAMLNVTG
jgi:hypothetical protein